MKLLQDVLSSLQRLKLDSLLFKNFQFYFGQWHFDIPREGTGTAKVNRLEEVAVNLRHITEGISTLYRGCITDSDHAQGASQTCCPPVTTPRTAIRSTLNPVSPLKITAGCKPTAAGVIMSLQKEAFYL